MPSKSRPRRRYSDAFRAAALAALDANAGNIERTARDLDVPRKTLEGWATARTPTPADLRHQKRTDLILSMESLADRLAGGIAARVDAGKGGIQQMAVALGITVDKLLLLKQLPTSITQDHSTAAMDVSKLSVADLMTLIGIQRKAEGRPPMLYAGDPNNPDAVCVDDDEPGGEGVTAEPAQEGQPWPGPEGPAAGDESPDGGCDR